MTTSGGFTRLLSVAGSDSGGGAGIQADLKAFARCGVHGMSAVTAITAQSTRGVGLTHEVPAEMIVAQIEAVAGDIGVDAVKVGMLGSRAAVVAVAGALRALEPRVPIVVDPVLVSSTGARLLDPDGFDAFCELILPLATVLTPNLPEARALVDHFGRRGAGDADTQREVADAGVEPQMADAGDEFGAGGSRSERGVGDGGREPQAGYPDGAAGLAWAVQGLGPGHVILTGGHRAVATDLYCDGRTIVEIPGRRHPGGAGHGSGCTHSAVLAAQLGLGLTVLEAARVARALTGEAVGSGLAGLGGGDGPVDILGLTRRIDPGSADRLP